MLDFPDSPNVGDQYLRWEWDGQKWIAISHHWSPPEAPIDGKTYGRRDEEWEEVLPIEGGTLTGDLTVQGRSELGTNIPADTIAVEIARDLQVIGRTFVRLVPVANNEAASKAYVDGKSHSEVITGDGTTLNFGVPHSFNTNAIVVSIWDVATEYMVLADVSIVDLNTIDIGFTDPPAAGKEYRVVVVS